MMQEPPLPPGLSFTPPQGSAPPLPQGLSFQPPARASAPASRPQAQALTGDPRAQILAAAGNARVTSGYRTPEHNRAVGGATRSYHTRGTGQAMDLVPGPGETMQQLYERLGQSGIPFQERLNEGDHVHVAWNGPGLGDPQQQAAPEPQPATQMQQAFQPALAAPGSSRETAIDLTAPTLYQDQVAALKKGAWVQARNGEIYQLPGDAYTAQPDNSSERQSRNVFLDRPDFGDKVDAFTQAAGEQVPFLDEAAAGVAGITTGRGYDAIREQQQLSRMLQNQTDRDARVAGGLAGFGLSLAAPGGSWVNGATGAARVGRAAALGAGYGGLFGAGNTDGGFSERAAAGGLQALIGGGAGAALQRGADVVGDFASQARLNPSPQRQLSAAGVDLTPGQMAGGALRRIEDGLQSVPIMGDAIRDARRRGLETFNQAAINEAVRPIGSVTGVGRQGMQGADALVSGAYDNALQGVSVPRDGQLDAALTYIARTDPLPQELQAGFGGLLTNYMQRFGQGMDGQSWKQLDSEIGAAIRSAQNGSATNPSLRLLADKLIQTRQAFQGALERADPFARASVGQADLAAAGLSRVRDASQSLGTSARDGLFTPGDLNRAVRSGDSSAGNRQFARGDALLQRLSDSATQVLPNTVPDSGTPFRSLVSVGGIGGGAAAIGANPIIPAAVGLGLFGGSAAYSRPMQAIINRAYRASTPGAARQVLADAQRQAAQTPALQPVYELLQSTLRPLLLDEPKARSTSR